MCELTDAEVANQILENIITFPLDCEQLAVDLLQGAACICLEFDVLLTTDMDTTISVFLFLENCL